MNLVRNFAISLCLLVLVACSIKPYQPADLAESPFTHRVVTEQLESLRVSVAVPDAGETQSLTGLDLYARGIQPVWLQIENSGTEALRITHWSVDRNYFSPIEVAYMNRKKVSSGSYADMQRWFHEQAMPRTIPAGESRSGLIFTNLVPGTKGVNLDVFSNSDDFNFTFFIPIPGFTADYSVVDFDSIYPATDIIELDEEGLKSALESTFPCCASGPTGEDSESPFNVVLVGTRLSVRRSLMRGGWLETQVDDKDTASARSQYYRQRPPDSTFFKARHDGNERIELRLWLSPWQVDTKPVWVAQAVFGTEATWLESNVDPELLPLFLQQSPAADLDSAKRHVLQNLWYNQSLRKMGFVGGAGVVSRDKPKAIANGGNYFTNGQRIVMFLSETPVSLHDTETLYRKPTPETQDDRTTRGRETPPPNDRQYSQTEGQIRVTTAVPSAEETRAIFQSNLYRQNIQPVWIQVENLSDSPLMLTPMGLDPGYYTARETAGRSLAAGDSMRRNLVFEMAGISELSLPPHSIQSGYIFSSVDMGTKSFNVDVFGDDLSYMMTFFVPVPGLKLDHYEIDASKLHKQDELENVDLQQLVRKLEAIPCCVRDAAGKDKGDPLNLVFIGEAHDLHYSFMRAGWDETETIHAKSLLKTAISATAGGRYRYSPVSALYVFDRPQDVAFQRARESIHERNHLRLWMTPLRHEGAPVWIGQISRDIGVHFTWRTITTHKIDPNVDETREFLVEDMAYGQLLSRFGYVGGVGSAPYDQPRGNLTGDPYFTDGRRVVMWIASEPSSIAEIEIIKLSEGNSPIPAPQ